MFSPVELPIAFAIAVGCYLLLLLCASWLKNKSAAAKAANEGAFWAGLANVDIEKVVNGIIALTAFFVTGYTIKRQITIQNAVSVHVVCEADQKHVQKLKIVSTTNLQSCGLRVRGVIIKDSKDALQTIEGQSDEYSVPCNTASTETAPSLYQILIDSHLDVKNALESAGLQARVVAFSAEVQGKLVTGEKKQIAIDERILCEPSSVLRSSSQ